jgi:hypothetical protein
LKCKFLFTKRDKILKFPNWCIAKCFVVIRKFENAEEADFEGVEEEKSEKKE